MTVGTVGVYAGAGVGLVEPDLLKMSLRYLELYLPAFCVPLTTCEFYLIFINK